MMTTSEAVIWQQRKNDETTAYLDTNEDLDDIDDEENEALEDDLPPEVPKRTSSKGVGSVPLASSTSASGRSSAGSLSIRGQVKSVGNGVANDAESQHPRDGPVRICSATGRPLVEWSSESTLGASERVRRHRLHHHHHHYYHHQQAHAHAHAHANSASYPRTTAGGLAGASVGANTGASASLGAPSMSAVGPPTRSSLQLVPSSSSLKKQVQTSSDRLDKMRQAASADEASDSDEIDVCETCSEWLGKALLCSCQVPSSASSSPSQGQHQVQQPPQGQHQVQLSSHHPPPEMLKQPRISYQQYQHQRPQPRMARL